MWRETQYSVFHFKSWDQFAVKWSCLEINLGLPFGPTLSENIVILTVASVHLRAVEEFLTLLTLQMK